MEIEEATGLTYARKRLCIKTKLADNILKSFKISFKGKSYWVRAKELFTWSPCFLEHKDEGMSDDEEEDNLDFLNDQVVADEGVDVLEVEGNDNRVPENAPEDEPLRANDTTADVLETQVEKNQRSEDPFGIYDLLNQPPNTNVEGLTSSRPYPPGYTPVPSHYEEDIEGVHNQNENQFISSFQAESPKVPHNQNLANHTDEYSAEGSTSVLSRKNINGGSILDVLEDIIKFMWGNSNFQYACSDSVGSSEGILCVWEQSIFKKEGVTVSDNFIALYGIWTPTNTKILIIVAYAPQSLSHKRSLWDYISSLIHRWNGEVVMLGDFNAVRSEAERFGSIFNSSCARSFNNFIGSSGLIDVKMEGYSFTWSHPSASKMSKLDRFLISDGILSTFPSISAVCLDRHLSDHRPIILREIQADFGPTPFRMYHSWFIRYGFDDMIRRTWQSLSHNDSNSLIRFKKKLQDLKKVIQIWIRDMNCIKEGAKKLLINQLVEIDLEIDNGNVTDGLLLKRLEILATRLSYVIASLVSNTQSAFIKNRHILDGPFILSETIAWCKSKKKQALIFKVDFAKAYDFVRWDFLLDTLQAFGFSSKWCFWIWGIFSSNMASILVNGSPFMEFPIACGLKQGDPLVPFLFILVMESVHISVTRACNEGIFKGLRIHDSLVLSHLFYVDDAVFIVEWSDENLKNLVRILNCFQLASGLKINMTKSQIMGVGVPLDVLNQGASSIRCATMTLPFKYLGVTVGDQMSRHSAWFNVRILINLTPAGIPFFMSTRFWLDPWLSDQTLSKKFPRIFALENDKTASVAFKRGAPSLNESFRRQ
nr:RNA-directed DNA polymerase, eukaryota [Tanacetum cinerariifolium]